MSAFNAELPGIAQAKAAAGQRVRLADLHANLTPAGIGPDGIHPTDDGYSKLANVWYSALQPVLGAGRAWPLFRHRDRPPRPSERNDDWRPSLGEWGTAVPEQ